MNRVDSKNAVDEAGESHFRHCNWMSGRDRNAMAAEVEADNRDIEIAEKAYDAWLLQEDLWMGTR